MKSKANQEVVFLQELVFATVIAEIKNVFASEISDSEMIKLLYDGVAKNTDPEVPIKKVGTDTARRIINRKPGGKPLKEIRIHSQDGKVRASIGEYFQNNVVCHFIPEMENEIISHLSRVIEEDTSISDGKRSELIRLGKKETFAEFLGQVYLYSLTRDNENKKDIEERNKKIDQSSKIALFLGLLSFLGTIILGIISARTTAKSNALIAKSNVEAAEVARISQADTNGDLGTLVYKERAIYERKRKTVLVRAFPYEKENNIIESSDTELFTIEAVIRNLKNNTWYRLASDVHHYPESASGQAYIFSERLEYVEDAAIIEWEWGEEHIKNRPFLMGQPISLDGTICATNPMTQITAELRKAGVIQEDSINIPIENEYSFSMKSSDLDVFLFENLPLGDDYQFIISVDYLSNGGKKHCTRTLVYDFDIVDNNSIT